MVHKTRKNRLYNLLSELINFNPGLKEIASKYCFVEFCFIFWIWVFFSKVGLFVCSCLVLLS